MTNIDDIPNCIVFPLHIALHKKDIGLTATPPRLKDDAGYLSRFIKIVLVTAIKSALKSMICCITGRRVDCNTEEEKIEIRPCRQHRPVTYHLHGNKALTLGTSETWIELKLFQKQLGSADFDEKSSWY